MRKKMMIAAGSVVGIGLIGLVAASVYFYQMAFVPSTKSFLSNNPPQLQQSAAKWLRTVPKETWTQKAAGANLRLVADYVPAPAASAKTVVIAHGYMGKKEDMAARIRMFHDAGFNVLAPDDRGHGHSQGDYIGYGWADRKDYLKWLDLLVARTGRNQQIALYGESMGGATVMYLAGEKLPAQVQAIVEDCGYTSVEDELAYQAQSMYHLPKWPLVPAVLAYARLKTGIDMAAASAPAQLVKNTRPILFIHGTKDTFVPPAMAKVNYRATTARKSLWLVPDAGHAQSFYHDPERYAKRVIGFVNESFSRTGEGGSR